MKRKSEFQNFDNTMRDLMKVPHSEIKASLAMEKKEKIKRKSKKVKSDTKN
jgi:hypothetical protein